MVRNPPRGARDDPDCLCGRELGGDEFALILPDLAAADDAYVIAAHVRESLAQPITIKNHEIRVSASIGFAIARVDDTQEGLVSRADEALYWVKRNGRDGVFLQGPETASAPTMAVMDPVPSSPFNRRAAAFPPPHAPSTPSMQCSNALP